MSAINAYTALEYTVLALFLPLLAAPGLVLHSCMSLLHEDKGLNVNWRKSTQIQGRELNPELSS